MISPFRSSLEATSARATSVATPCESMKTSGVSWKLFVLAIGTSWNWIASRAALGVSRVMIHS